MKDPERLEDLAVFGGKPAFDSVLHVGRPNIGDRAKLLERLNRMLDQRWLTNHGPLVCEFEAKTAKHLGVKHCLAVCNATVGLEIAIRALDMEGEVIVPAMTFVATAHALQWQEIKPVFCDIDPVTFNVDPASAEELVGPRTTGILGVHLWGRPCAVEALTDIARRHQLKLLFDAAHAFGCTHRGVPVGSFGDAEVFSFHATKMVNAFEGGMIATNDDSLAKKMRLMTNFGFAGYDDVAYIGTNGKMSEASAAMGLTSLESYEEFARVNERNYDHYRLKLDGVPGVRFIEYDRTEINNFHYVIVEIGGGAGLTRDRLMKILWAENVQARRYFYPGCHRMEPYRTLYPDASVRLPVVESASKRVLALPTGTAVGPPEIDAIASIIRFAAAEGGGISERLGVDSL